MNKGNLRSYLAGVLTVVLFLVFCIPSLAATGQRQITATYKDIRIRINGAEITPQDANGTVVEPFVSNGTTYLPIRAVGDALGYNVQWDGATNTVSLTGGQQSPVPEQGVIDLTFYHGLSNLSDMIDEALGIQNSMLGAVGVSPSDYYYYQDMAYDYFTMINERADSVFSYNIQDDVSAYLTAYQTLVQDLTDIQAMIETYASTFAPDALDRYNVTFTNALDTNSAMLLAAEDAFYAQAIELLGG